MSTAIVSNLALAGSAARLAQARAVVRQAVEGAQGPSATLGRDKTSSTVASATGLNGGRRGQFQDLVANFGGVLVSSEVGDTLVHAQASSASDSPQPAEAEKQLSNYEYIQSLAEPDETVTPSVTIH